MSDWISAVPDQVAPWIPGGLRTLGTDGYGRSDSREALRQHFGVDRDSIVGAVLAGVEVDGSVPAKRRPIPAGSPRLTILGEAARASSDVDDAIAGRSKRVIDRVTGAATSGYLKLS